MSTANETEEPNDPTGHPYRQATSGVPAESKTAVRVALVLLSVSLE